MTKSFPLLRIGFSLVTLTAALFQVGCSQADGAGADSLNAKSWEGATPEAIVPPVPGDPAIFGTWTGPSGGVGTFDNLVLMTDGRYHRSHLVVCVKAPCPPIGEDGTFELSKRDGVRYIGFTAQGSKGVERYEFVYKTDLLRIRHILPGSEWYSMNRAKVSWCAAPKDCTMQALPAGTCVGEYACTENQCTWQCVTRGEPAAK